MPVNYPAVNKHWLCKDVCMGVSLQECGHAHSRCVSSVGHSSQTADLAVHLPATDLRRTGTVPEQVVTLPGLQEQW